MKKLLLSLFSVAVFFTAAHQAQAYPMVPADDGRWSDSQGVAALFPIGDIGDLITNFVKAGNTQWRLYQQKTERWDDLFNRVQLTLGKSTTDLVLEDSDAEEMVISDSNDPMVVPENGDVESGMTDDSTSPVPEPATLFLIGSGMLGLFGFGRKKQN